MNIMGTKITNSEMNIAKKTAPAENVHILSIVNLL